MTTPDRQSMTGRQLAAAPLLCGWLPTYCPHHGMQWQRVVQRDHSWTWLGPYRELWLFFDVTCTKCRRTWGPHCSPATAVVEQKRKPTWNPYYPDDRSLPNPWR